MVKDAEHLKYMSAFLFHIFRCSSAYLLNDSFVI